MPRPTRSPYDDNKPWLDSARAEAMSAGFLHQATVTLDNDEIIALPTTPVTIIAALADKVIIPNFAVLHLANWAADYGDIHAAALIVVALNSSAGIFSIVDNSTASEVSSLLAGGGPDGTFTFLGPAQRVATLTKALGGYYESDIVNKPLTIAMDNNNGQLLSGGNAAQSLIVSVAYYVLNTVTGEFE